MQLGLLQVAEGLLEKNGKANPTDTELLPNVYASCLDPQLVASFSTKQLTWLSSGGYVCLWKYSGRASSGM